MLLLQPALNCTYVILHLLRLIERLFHNALEESRPKSVLFNSLSVCISLLDPKRQTFGTYNAYGRQFSQGSSITVNPETVEGMLGSLGKMISFSYLLCLLVEFSKMCGLLKYPLDDNNNDKA